MARCHALAEAMNQYVKVDVLLDAGCESWGEKYLQLGISPQYCQALEELPDPMPSWDGVIIDGYDFSPTYYERFAQLSPMLVVIDDFLSPPACATMALNPTMGLHGSNIGTVPALMGAEFALIDPAYQHIKAHKVGGSVGRVIVSCGMGDPARSNELMIAALDLLYPDHRELSAMIAVGGHVSHLAELETLAQQADIPVEIKVDVTDMINLYGSTDLVIGAGGGSLLERMACGLPSASIVIAENQRAAIHGAVEVGGTLDLGDLDGQTPTTLAEKLRPLLENQSLRRAMANQARKTIDGRGANRAAKALLAFARQPSLSHPTSGKDS